MPKLNTGTAAPAANGKSARPTVKTIKVPSPAPARAAEAAPVVKYPQLEVKHRYAGTHPYKGTLTRALTAAEAASPALLWLESESEWAARAAREQGLTLDVSDPKRLGLRLPDNKTLFTDPTSGERVVCWNNLHNRPFSISDCEAYVQDILTRNWAGPTTFPGETVNGETISVSRTGQIISGQKRLVALWLARREWDRDEKWQEFWPRAEFPDGPVMDALVVLGVSDDRRVIQTVDNTQPRSAADTFYTGDVAERVLGAAFTEALRRDRLEVCRMLQAAAEFLWKRTGRKEIRTNRAVQGFVDANPAILSAVGKVFTLNRGRKIALMRLSPGQSAAQLWLAAASPTDRGAWDGREESLDLGALPDAEAFWDTLAAGEGWPGVAVAEAVSKLTDLSAEGEASANAAAKCAVIAGAWWAWANGEERTTDQLLPETVRGEDGLPRLLDPPTFGGVDLG